MLKVFFFQQSPHGKSFSNKTEKSEDGNTDSGGTDPELSDVPFLVCKFLIFSN